MNATKHREILEGKPAAVYKRIAAWDKIYLPARQTPPKIKAKLLWKFLNPQSYHICVAWLKTCFSHMAPLKLDGLSIRMERNCSECPYVQR